MASSQKQICQVREQKKYTEVNSGCFPDFRKKPGFFFFPKELWFDDKVMWWGGGGTFECFLPTRGYSKCLGYIDPSDPQMLGRRCYYPHIIEEEREAQTANTTVRCRNMKSLICVIQEGSIRWKAKKTKKGGEFISESLLLLDLWLFMVESSVTVVV